MSELKPSSEYPIFPKTYDLIHWLMTVTVNFPKSQRFVLARRIEEAALNFYEYLLEARKVDPASRRDVLCRADVEYDLITRG